MKNAFYLIFFSVLLVASLVSCEETSIEFEGYSSEQVGFLLSADSIKTWQLKSQAIDGQPQEITDCQQYLQMRFIIDDTEEETDSTATRRISPVDGCSEEIIFSGDWQVSAGSQVDTLFFQLEDVVLTRYITSLTSMRLEYYYLDNNSRVTEVFSAID